MPTKGTPRLSFRCSQELQLDIQECIARRNTWSREAPWTLSDFIGLACREKIAKMGRSRKAEVETSDRLPDELAGK